MVELYWVRHAKPDLSIRDDMLRPLTEEGREDAKVVTRFLLSRGITRVYSSPYKRAVETIADFAKVSGLEINIVEDFRERKVSNRWIEDFDAFTARQWSDFGYSLADGESLHEVQQRNIQALEAVVKELDHGRAVIGTHGTALSTIINHYDRRFDHSQFERIKNKMLLIVRMRFEHAHITEIEEYELE